SWRVSVRRGLRGAQGSGLAGQSSEVAIGSVGRARAGLFLLEVDDLALASLEVPTGGQLGIDDLDFDVVAIDRSKQNFGAGEVLALLDRLRLVVGGQEQRGRGHAASGVDDRDQLELLERVLAELDVSLLANDLDRLGGLDDGRGQV